jgi:hypothetical protein
MDRQATFLLALGLLIAAGAVVSVVGWILFVRDRRAERPVGADEGGTERSAEGVTSTMDQRSSDA